MKIDRLIGILSILLQQEQVTAPCLAEKFEVSRRTINRDIEDICKAGIPIVTTQGRGGGITIMEGYRIDKTLLSSADMQAILAGLKGLDSVSGTKRYQQLMDKLSVGNANILDNNNHVCIDLSSWHKTTLAPKIALIQQAIEDKERIAFTYFAPKGESSRVVEPKLLVFQWASWYVWGYCLKRRDFRMFKLNRMLDVMGTGEPAEEREVPLLQINSKQIFPHQIYAKTVFAPAMKWRLIDEYGVDSFQEMEDGTLELLSGFTDKQSLFGWLLSFGNQAELIEPEELRREFKDWIIQISKKYES